MTDERDDTIRELRAMIRDGHVSALSDKERCAFEMKLLSMIEEANTTQRRLQRNAEKMAARINALDKKAVTLEQTQGSLDAAVRHLGTKPRLRLN